MTINPDGRRQSLGALSGSREPDPSCTGSGPSGFDPERVEDYRDFPFAGPFTQAAPRLGWAAGGLVISASPQLSVACTNNGLRHFTGWTHKGFHYCPTAPWQDWVTLAERILDVENRRHAIAMEARRGETPKSGSTAGGGDSAGPQDIAQPPVTP